MGYYFSPALFRMPTRVVEPVNWAGHVPFAFWLVETIRPELLVELGTHSGNSFFAFCQAVEQGRVSAKCYAVDTWEGDEHAGAYGEEIYRAVLEHAEQEYGAFASLMKMTFDNALQYFSDGSIDLLHIDGMHSYEAVKHDFESWLPKLSDRSVVLFHDIAVRERGFGVWKLWEELSLQYPHFAFDHSHGLGVLLTGREQNELLRERAAEWNEPEKQKSTKSLFSMAGERVVYKFMHEKYEQALYEQQEMVHELRHSLQEANRLVLEKEGLIDQQQEELDELTKKYLRIMGSSSWRLTKPVRKISKSLRKRLRKLKFFFLQKKMIQD